MKVRADLFRQGAGNAIARYGFPGAGAGSRGQMGWTICSPGFPRATPNRLRLEQTRVAIPHSRLKEALAGADAISQCQFRRVNDFRPPVKPMCRAKASNPVRNNTISLRGILC